MMEFAQTFGTPGGDKAFADLQDTRAQTLQRLAQTEYEKSLTAEANVRTERAKVQMKQEQAFLEKLANYKTPQAGQAPDGTPRTQADQLDEIGSMMISLGMVEKGSKLVEGANLMRSRDAHAKDAAALAQMRLAENHAKAMGDLYNLVSSSTDEPSFNRAKMLFMSQHPDEKLPPVFNTYNPDVIRQLLPVTKAGAEKAKNDWKVVQEEGKDRRAEERREAQREHDERVFERQKTLEAIRQKNREANRKVAGDKTPVVGQAPRDSVIAAQAMIQRDYPDLPADTYLGKDNKVSLAAIDMANEAKALVSRNRGMSMSEALQRTYQQMRTSGAFTSGVEPATTIGGVKVPFTGGKKTTKYQQGGSEPQALPSDPSKLEDGAVYRTPKGTFQYDKAAGGMRPVKAPKRPATLPPPEPDDTEDDDE